MTTQSIGVSSTTIVSLRSSAGGPISARNVSRRPSRPSSVRRRGPATVPTTSVSPVGVRRSCAIHAAAQRTPLPEISASPPSAFQRSVSTPSGVGRSSIRPSPPMPRCRLQRRRARSAMSVASGTCCRSSSRKSLPNAWALTSGQDRGVVMPLLFLADGQQVPAEPLHPAARQRVEGAYEERVVGGALPSLVQAAAYGKSLEDEFDARELPEERLKLGGRIPLEDGRILVLERRLHDLRQQVQPGHAVVHLEQHRAAG